MSRDARILIVDDYEGMRGILKEILDSMGITKIKEATDGAEALRLLAEAPFDLIICDWDMPGISGIELFQQLKKSPKTRDIPFCMVTGMKDAEHVRHALKEGIRHYVIKPVATDTFIKKIESMLNPASSRDATLVFEDC
jgi:two-component system chemotaxis response regulator CheY